MSSIYADFFGLDDYDTCEQEPFLSPISFVKLAREKAEYRVFYVRATK